MRLRPSGPLGPALRWRLIATLLLALPGSLARAQALGERGFGSQGPGIAWGPAIVHPVLTMYYGYDNNIFYASDDLQGSDLLASRETQVQPGIRFEIPFGESHISGGYAALYRNYSTSEYSPTTQWSHYFDMSGHVRAGSRAYFNLSDRFVRGTEELRVIDPGGELTFGDLPFRSHTPSVEAGLDLGARQGVSLVWSYNSSQFSDDAGTGVFNYRGHGLQARYNYKLGVATNAYLYAGQDIMNQVRDDERVEYQGHGTGIGLTQVLNRVVSTTVTAGYQVLDASGAVNSAYHGPALSGNISWLVGDTTRLILGVRRLPYQSFYLNNSYYLSRSLSLEAVHQAGGSTYWRLLAGFDQNRYSDPLDVTGFEGVYCLDQGSGPVCPSEGIRRRDAGWHGEAGFGVQVSRLARWYLGYTWQARSSNIEQADVDGFGDPFSYTVNRYFFRIEVGWL